MELPSPDMDELGRPWWCGTSADVSKAYRRLSILVHPVSRPWRDRRVASCCARGSFGCQERECWQWGCTVNLIARVRRREACVAAALQDKNPGPDARAAFEALNKAHRELKDAGSRVCRSRACILHV